MARAILIPANQREQITEVDVDVSDFDALAEAIGSRYVEFVRIMDPAHRAVVDEAAALTREPLNERATLYPGGLRGDVLIVGWDQSQSYSEDGIEMCAATVPLDEVTSWLMENER